MIKQQVTAHGYFRFTDSGGCIVGQIDQKVLKSTLRVEYFVTPEFSIQYYGSPYASTGKYQRFRKIKVGDSKKLNKHYISFEGQLDNRIYSFAEGDDSYRIYNPNFIFKEFNSNLVD